MGKRSDFEKMDRSLYRTPAEAMPFLAPFLPKTFTFCEPCAADGPLTRHLEKMGGTPLAQFDIHPLAPGIRRMDARRLLSHHLNGAEFIITNPPWDRPLLHPMIRRFSMLAPSWVLFDADWAFTDQGAQFMDAARGRNVIRKIVAVGRLIWIPGTTDTGKDNVAWYELGPASHEPTLFFPRLT